MPELQAETQAELMGEAFGFYVNDLVTRDYLEAHIDRANREHTPVGLLIHRIRAHDPKPKKKLDSQDPESYRRSWLGKA